MRQIGTLFGRPIAQYWEDLEKWESVLNTYPARLNWIVELGTWQGGMSYFLKAQTKARGIWFLTLDIKEPELPVDNFNKWDIKNGFPEFFEGHPMNTPGILFCDNGNKPEEVKLYKDLIHPESCIAVHDWGTEFQLDDIPEEWAVLTYTSTTIFLSKRDFLMQTGRMGIQFR